MNIIFSKSEIKTRILALGCTLGVVCGAWADTNLLTDTFAITGTPDATDLNYELSLRQTGALALMPWAGANTWQCQVGNGGNNELLLAGSQAYLQNDFAPTANAVNKPLVITFNGKVSFDNGVSSSWFSLNLNNTSSGYGPDYASFCALFRENGGSQMFKNGSLLASPNWSATGVTNQYQTFKAIFSDPPGTGSPFNGKGSIVKIYAGATLLGGYALNQLSSGYIGFGGTNYPVLVNIDNVQVSVLMSSGAMITAQPQSLTNNVGTAASFTVAVVGGGPTQYQWYKVPAIPIPGATNATYNLWSVEPGDAGSYYCVATGSFGTLQSSNATLVVPSASLPQFQATLIPNQALVDSFDGWGVSLCWWANVCGGYGNRETYASLAFTTLGLNIARYNIGGGENPGISNTMQYRAQMPGFEPTNGVWNWNADQNQRWMLKRAIALGVNHVYAFANSPPWWMTVSGSVTGSADGTSDNLQTGYENTFAQYLSMVVSNLTVVDGVKFDAVTPMNEPTGSWWKLGNWQEGCHMEASQQNRVVNDLRNNLTSCGLVTGIGASEDTDEQDTINSVGAYDAAGQANVTLIASHTYGANNPSGLQNFAASLRKPLWISEYGDGDGSGMTMAQRIHDDITQTGTRAWTYWQLVDGVSGWALVYNPEDGSGNTNYWFNEKFYVLWQFSHFIRPGFQILNVSDAGQSLAAYDPANHNLIVVAINVSTNALNTTYNLGAFSSTGNQVSRWRTSASEYGNPLAMLAIASQQFIAYLAPQSVTTLVISNVVMNTQPAAWYPMEGNIQDATGNGNHATQVNNVSYIPGKIGALAAQFNGNNNSYAVIPLSISNSFTITGWVKTSATGNVGNGQWWNGRGIVDGEVPGSVSDFGLTLMGSHAAFGIGNPDTTITSTTAINDGQWHQVAAEWNNLTGVMQLYVDGQLQATAIGPTGTRTAPPSLRLGSIQAGYAAGFLGGALDDVRLFDRTLSAAEVVGTLNRAPTLNTIPGSTILAGRTLLITNTANDPDLPAQTLAWSLSSAPAGATISSINPTNGVLSWRPMMAQSPSTNTFNVVVMDNGTPPLGATQGVTVKVVQPRSPQLFKPTWVGSSFTMQVTGDAGPDYAIETATNLSNPVRWQPVITNYAATPPFQWTNTSVGNQSQGFYRVRLAP